MYDLDALDYTVGGDKHLSALDKTKAYVGEGNDVSKSLQTTISGLHYVYMISFRLSLM